MHLDSSALVVLLTSLFVSACECIRITNLEVPDVANERSDVTLVCKFALEGSVLYAAKWYRNGMEFYRYAPKDNPPGQAFDSGGLRIDLRRSDEESVTLEQLELDDGGDYTCEVSGETPYFRTDTAKKSMRVVALPDASPIISGGKNSYHVGNVIDVNCTSQKSKPALNLTWFINGLRAPPTFVKTYKYTKDKKGKYRRTANLRFEADESMFFSGRMVLKCTAVAEKTYDENSEPSLVASYRKSSDVVFSRVEVTDLKSTASSTSTEMVTLRCLRILLTTFTIASLR